MELCDGGNMENYILKEVYMYVPLPLKTDREN